MDYAVLDKRPQGASTEEELEQLLVECDHSTKAFCQTFFPELFTRPFSANIHDPIFKILDDDSIQKAAIAAPRGCGKSTIIGAVVPVKRICFEDSHYIIPVSATGDAAVEQSENIKSALVENELITMIFGDRTPQARTDPFGQREWVTRPAEGSRLGCTIKPRGAGQQVRGRQRRGRRPDFIPVDDLEDDESVENEDLRKKLRKWFFSALINSVDRGSTSWRVIVVGTVLHENSLLVELLDEEKHPDWRSVKLELFDDEYKSQWPEYLSDDGIQTLVNDYRTSGEMDVLYREFRNIPVAHENQAFLQEYFRYYTESEEDINKDSGWISVVLSDPARTMSAGSADTAVVGMSVNRATGRILVRDVVAAKMHPDELYEEMFAMAERINALVLAPEVTGLNEYITFPLRNAMLEKGIFHVIVEVKPREGKTGPKRSAGLVPWYRQGKIEHNKSACGGLELALMQWPRPAKWDVIDCVSGIIYVLEDAEEYFLPPDTDPDDETRDIEYDEPVAMESWI